MQQMPRSRALGGFLGGRYFAFFNVLSLFFFVVRVLFSAELQYDECCGVSCVHAQMVWARASLACV